MSTRTVVDVSRQHLTDVHVTTYDPGLDLADEVVVRTDSADIILPDPIGLWEQLTDALHGAYEAAPEMLLEALVEAGVLRERKCSHHDQCVNCRDLEPMTRSEGRHAGCHARYVTEWRPTDA